MRETLRSFARSLKRWQPSHVESETQGSPKEGKERVLTKDVGERKLEAHLFHFLSFSSRESRRSLIRSWWWDKTILRRRLV